MKRKNKKGQIEVQFNWIYILIAGAVILLFFVGIVIKQKYVSEQKLSATVIRKLESIFTGAGLGEKAVNIIGIPKLNLDFTCDKDGYSEYSIRGTGIKEETPNRPIFAIPMETEELVTWTLEWKMPFKVINYLMITSSDIRYVFFYDENNIQSLNQKNSLYLQIPAELGLVEFIGVNRNPFDILSYRLTRSGEKKDRLVFIDTEPFLPPGLENVLDEDVSAVKLNPTGIQFYKKQGAVLVPDGNPVVLIDSFTEINPNLMAAIFAKDRESYECNLRKGFRRLMVLAEIYQKRTEEIQDKYNAEGSEWAKGCAIIAGQGKEKFEAIIQNYGVCAAGIVNTCRTGLGNTASNIETSNNNLLEEGCATIY